MNAYETKQRNRILKLMRAISSGRIVINDIHGSDEACRALAIALDELILLERGFIDAHKREAIA